MNSLVPVSNETPESAPSGHAKWEILLVEANHAIAHGVPILLDPAQMHPMKGKGQPRTEFNDGDIVLLREGIKAVGQTYPGYVRKTDEFDSLGREIFEICDGERRWKAISGIPGSLYRAIVIEIRDEAIPYLIAAVTNFNRVAHTHLELSDTTVRLHHDMGMPFEVIATILGLSEDWVYKMYSLRLLVPEVRLMLRRDTPKARKLPIAHALIIAIEDPLIQLKMAERVLAKEVNLGSLRRASKIAARAAGAKVRDRAREPSVFLRANSLRIQKIQQTIRDMHAEVSVRNDLRSVARGSLAKQLQKFENEIAIGITELDKTLKLIATKKQ